MTVGLGGSVPGFELSTAHPGGPSVAARSNHVGFPEDSNINQDKPHDDSRVLFVLPPQIPEGSQVASERKHTLHNGRHVICEANDEQGTNCHRKQRLEKQHQQEVKHVERTGRREMPSRRVLDVWNETKVSLRCCSAVGFVLGSGVGVRVRRSDPTATLSTPLELTILVSLGGGFTRSRRLETPTLAITTAEPVTTVAVTVGAIGVGRATPTPSPTPSLRPPWLGALPGPMTFFSTVVASTRLGG